MCVHAGYYGNKVENTLRILGTSEIDQDKEYIHILVSIHVVVGVGTGGAGVRL